MNYIIITACYEFIYMYRDPWRTGAWTRTDTQPGQPGAGRRMPPGAEASDAPPDTGNPAGAHPTRPAENPF